MSSPIKNKISDEECILCFKEPKNTKQCHNCDQLFCEICINEHLELIGTCPHCNNILISAQLTPIKSPKRVKISECSTQATMLPDENKDVAVEENSINDKENKPSVKAPNEERHLDSVTKEDNADEQMDIQSVNQEHHIGSEKGQEKDDDKSDVQMLTEEEKGLQTMIDLCGVHGNSLFLYCSEDKICICMTCMMSSEHALHNFQNIEKVYAVERVDVEQKLQEIIAYFSGLINIVREIDENLKSLEVEEKAVMVKVSDQLALEANKLSIQKQKLKYSELMIKKENLLERSDRIREYLAKMESMVDKITKPELIAAEKAIMEKLFKITANPLQDFEHKTIPSKFISDFIPDFSVGNVRVLKAKSLLDDKCSVKFVDDFEIVWQFLFYVDKSDGFLKYDMKRYSVVGRYEWIINIHNSENIKHTEYIDTSKVEKENVKIVKQEFLLQHGFYVQGELKISIFSRPTNIFDESAILEKLIATKTGEIEKLILSKTHQETKLAHLKKAAIKKQAKSNKNLRDNQRKHNATS